MTVTLKANNHVYSGWITAEVERSLNAVSGHFAINYSDKLSDQKTVWNLKAGEVCELSLDGETVISGSIDSVECDLSGDSRHLSVSGRDRTGNLVDSGTLTKQKSFKGISLKSMAEELASPFNVHVSSNSESANALINTITFQYHETIWETINRLAHYQGVLAYPDANGGIIFSDVSNDVIDTLDETKNISEINAKYDASEKFKKYIAVSHSGSPEQKITTIRAEATDNSVVLPRCKIITISKNTDKNGAQARANWEMGMHIAKSFHANVTLIGWKNSKEKLWQINTLVHVNAPSCNVVGDFLIESTKFFLEEDRGMITQLTLVLPDAYKPQPDRNVEDNE
jgi:prophage tail gpP-like protein